MFDQLEILVAIAHQRTRDRVVAGIEAREDQFVVAVTDNARRAVDLIEELQPDVAIVQRRLPIFGSGFVLRGVHEAGLETGVVVLSGYVRADEALAAISAGADAFLPIESSAAEVCDAVVRAAEGQVTVPADIRQQIAVGTP